LKQVNFCSVHTNKQRMQKCKETVKPGA